MPEPYVLISNKKYPNIKLKITQHEKIKSIPTFAIITFHIRM